LNPLTISNFSPRAEITIQTTSGDTISSNDILGSAVTLQTTRSIDGNAGQFILQLTASKKNGKSWQDRIHIMDYVVIKLGNRNDLHVRMRGFIDSVSESIAMSPTGGPQRSVTITGRDYTKLFLDMDLQYMWQIMLPDGSGSVPGLSKNFDIPAMVTMPVEDIIKLLVSNILNGDGAIKQYAFIPNFNRVSKVTIPKLGYEFAVPDKYLIWTGTIQPYTGAFWNLITYFESAPLGEIFISDTDDGPILVCRVAPFKDANGNYTNLSQAPYLPDITIDPSTVTLCNLGKLGEQILNYFFSYPDTNANNGSPMVAYASPGITGDLFNTNFSTQSSPSSNPAWVSDSVDLYGFRPLNIVTPWLCVANTGPQTADAAAAASNTGIQLASELSTHAAQVFGHNENLISGVIMCHGAAEIMPGRYANFGDASYYIEKVTEILDFVGTQGATWNATLMVTRGQSI